MHIVCEIIVKNDDLFILRFLWQLSGLTETGIIQSVGHKMSKCRAFCF